MFTGIIQDLVKINKIKKINQIPVIKKIDVDSNNNNDVLYTEITLNLKKKFKNLKIGNSIAINGVCLTIAKIDKNQITFQIVNETMQKSCFSNMKKGDKVNVERSLKVGDRLEGHFILGHVDCIGKINSIMKNKTSNNVLIEITDKSVLHLIAQKGSIAIDGISLTVVEIVEDKVKIALIPHTIENTTLGIKNKGDFVNVEIDILSRYISRIYQDFGNNK
jgi:riboflavin synthase